MNKIKTTYFIFMLSCILCFASCIIHAQTKSTDVKTINGKKYYIHKVEKGQSLYAIAKVYGMDVNSILAENDEAIDGLKHGQELKIPFESLLVKQAVVIDTNKYVYHKIIKGETVYGITKKYSIDEKKLTSYNPTILSGLKEGDYIIVSEKKKSTSIKPSTITTTVSSASSNSYTVQQGETLYGISKKLNVSQDDILLWNPELKDGIKPGQVLKTVATKVTSTPINTPLTNTNSTTIVPVTKDTTIIHKYRKSSYNVGLFLPFKLFESENINIDELARAKVSFPPTQSLALDFYFGFKKAVDSLKSKEFDVSIRLFDTEERDSTKIENICKTQDFKTLDAVFGPLYTDVFKLVSNCTKKLGIPIVSPVIQQNKILYDNSLASKVTPSVYTLIESLADYCTDSLLAISNIIIVNSTNKDQHYIKAFKNRYNEALVKHSKTLKDSIIEVKGLGGVKAAYVAGKKNVIVLLTNNLVYLQDFITQLYVFSDKKDISLMGFSSVSTIDNLDQDYLNALQFHFAAPNHIDFKDSNIRQLSKQYQAVFTTDPSEYYFQGFDIGTYYLSNLKTLGPDFFFNLDKTMGQGVSTGFKFYRPDSETGFENRAVYIYKYSNYQLQKLGWK
jgi:LysM repeat protein